MLSILVLAASFGYQPNAPQCKQLHIPKVRQNLATQESVATGKHFDGKLLKPAQVPLYRKFLSVLPGEHIQRRRNYGVSELVNALSIVSSNLYEEHRELTIYIGDISAKRGGRITRHRSHQNGLDVDVAFLYRDKSGNLITPTGFWGIGEDGITSKAQNVFLDPMLNWKFVEGLLSSSQIEVQWIFVSKPVKAQLLEAGRAQNAPEEILYRAQTILHQPTRGLPHDDHFHVRIYCPPSDRLQGCVDSGPVWSWVVQPPPPPQIDPALLAPITDPDEGLHLPDMNQKWVNDP